MGIGKIIQIVLIVISIIIVIIVLLQGGKAQGLGGTLTGTTDSSLFESSKENIPERKTNKITLTLGIIFIAIILITSICMAFNLFKI